MDWYELRRNDFSLSSDHQQLRASFHSFFSKECPLEVVRAAEPLGFDAGLWKRLCNMDAVAMSLPEVKGGAGATLVELVLICEELGRALAPVPLVGHCVAARLLAATEASQRFIDRAAAGTAIFALALQRFLRAPLLVPDAALAAGVLALEGDELCLYETAHPVQHVRNQGSTPLAWWQPVDDARRIVLADGNRAASLHAAAAREWRLLMSAALIGLAEGALRLAVDFARSRNTLGVPIGSLQGVSFQLADIQIGIRAGRHLIWRAAWMHEHEPGGRSELIEMALPYAARVATHAAAHGQHVQGGLGFSAEAPSSLYFLRSKGWSVLGGNPQDGFTRVADVYLNRELRSAGR